MRSSLAKGEGNKHNWSFLSARNKPLVESLLYSLAKKYHLTVYRFVNVGNHLHIIIKCESKKYFIARAEFSKFLRQFTGAVAMSVTGASKSNPVIDEKGRQCRFWDYLAYSRLVTWGREFEGLIDYLVKNSFEAAGLLNRKKDPGAKLIRFVCEEAGIPPPWARVPQQAFVM